ncbi:MAG: glutathione binding-like protein, partial [Methylocystis sp.]
LYAAEKIPYAIDRYRDEAARLYRVLDTQLGKTGAYVAGDDYSIADIACYPWIVPHEDQGQDLHDFPHLKRWFEAIHSRPAVIRAYAAGAPYERSRLDFTALEREILFGQSSERGGAK